MVIAHMVILLILIAIQLNNEFEMNLFFLLGFVIGQMVLLGTYAACVAQPLLIKLRWVYRLTFFQWGCLIVPFLTQTSDWPVPLCLFLDQVILFTAALLGAGLFRLLTRRVVTGKPAQVVVAKLQITDLFVFTTIVAVVLTVIRQFHDPVPKIAGLPYVFVILAGLFVGAPIAFLLPVSLSGFLVKNKTFAGTWMSIWALAVVAIAAYSLMAVEELEWFAFIVGTGLALFPSALVVRKMGFQLEPKERSNSMETKTGRMLSTCSPDRS